MKAINIIKKTDEDRIYDKTKKLKEDVIKKINELTTITSNEYLEQAKISYKNGDLLDAYQLLELIELHDPNIDQFKSKIAFEIGERRYNNILSDDFNVNKFEIRETLYWFSKVDRNSEYFEKSKYYINILKKHLNR